jgi:hypothetical protein
LSINELKTKNLTEEEKPEIITDEMIRQGKHVNRLWEQEPDLNSILFQNKDGTKTLYTYDEPVKYKDKDGKIKDKNTELSTGIDKTSYKTNYQYTNQENDVRLYFPKKISSANGVIFENNETTIQVYPSYKIENKAPQESKIEEETSQNGGVEEASKQDTDKVTFNEAPSEEQSIEKVDSDRNIPEGSNTLEESSKQENTEQKLVKQKISINSSSVTKKVKNNKNNTTQDMVEYTDVFGKDTVLRYTPKLNGFKEDIILNKNIGSNEFSFIFNVGTLQPVQNEEGYIFLSDPLTGEEKAKINPIYIYMTAMKVKSLMTALIIKSCWKSLTIKVITK